MKCETFSSKICEILESILPSSFQLYPCIVLYFILPHPKPLFQSYIKGSSGNRGDPTASSILTPHNSCDLTPPMCGTQQNWNSVWQEGPLDNYTAPRTNPHPQGGFGIDPRIGAAALRAPAASKEDSHPQAILKFKPRNSFD